MMNKPELWPSCCCCLDADVLNLDCWALAVDVMLDAIGSRQVFSFALLEKARYITIHVKR